MEIRKAVRKKAKIRLGLAGPSGSGKTYSALLIAFGLDAGKIGMIDTEHGSGDLYAHLGDYDIIQLKPPYTVAQYREALKTFVDAGYGVVILDSISHAWAGEGGLLDQHGQHTDASRAKDSFAAWRKVTPDHNRFIDAMLSAPCHIIATMRSKTEYILIDVERGGRTVKEPRKVGMAPVQREGMEYEFTAVLDIDTDHVARTSKDRTGLFGDIQIKISQETGAKIKAWMDAGIDEPQPVQTETGEAPEKIDEVLARISAAPDIDALKKAFQEPYEYAKAFGDRERGMQLIAAVNARKAELELDKAI